MAGLSSDGLQTALAVAAPIVALLGGLTALWRTYRNWRRGGRWQVWQGASWFLLAFFIFVLMGSSSFLVG